MHQVEHTFPEPAEAAATSSVTWRDVRRGLTMLARIIWHVGIAGDYKRVFWAFALPRLIRGDIESRDRHGADLHHLIVFSREASGGLQNASHYSAPAARDRRRSPNTVSGCSNQL